MVVNQFTSCLTTIKFANNCMYGPCQMKSSRNYDYRLNAGKGMHLEVEGKLMAAPLVLVLYLPMVVDLLGKDQVLKMAL